MSAQHHLYVSYKAIAQRRRGTSHQKVTHYHAKIVKKLNEHIYRREAGNESMA
ncbi:MAG: hypothetical protein ACK5C0_14205 [Candidatus Kapaibacterium sp.]